MSRQLRLDFPGAVHHISNRGHYRQDIFFCDDDRILFLNLLGEVVAKFGWLVHVYTLMTNHFHLLIETPEANLSRGMQELQQKYAQRMNRKLGRRGNLFQDRFSNELVEKESHLLEAARYVVLNPVRAHMVERPEDYRWSSYRATAGYEPAPSWLTTDWLLAQFAPLASEAPQAYRTFVDEGVGLQRSPWDDLRHRIYLGTEAWMEKMRAIVEEKQRSLEHPREQRCIARPDVQTVIATVAEVMDVSAEAIVEERGGLARMLVAHLAFREGLVRLRDIAQSLMLRSSGHISTLAKRCSGLVAQQREISVIADECLARLRAGAFVMT